MGHKADLSFFEKKRSWSERKDLVLGYYLTPYLPKVATQKRPVLLVDAFAGPGRFGDGKPGSPLIICNTARDANARPLQVPVRVLAIEPEPALHGPLVALLQQFDCARVKNATFLDVLPEIEAAARTHSVFLYVDPWTVEGLEWTSLERLFALLRTGRSVEILMNFNASSFVRRGLAILKCGTPEDASEDDGEPADPEPPSAASLNSVVGGEWWQRTLRDAVGFAAQVEAIACGFCERLREHFREVCVHPLFANPSHRVPKYYLVFGSRSPHALRLMNDAMVRSREEFAVAALPKENLLFEMRPVSLVPDHTRLPALVLAELCGRVPRGVLIESVMRVHLGMYSETAIRRAITGLIKAGRVQSATGKARINDEVEIWAPARAG